MTLLAIYILSIIATVANALIIRQRNRIMGSTLFTIRFVEAIDTIP